MKTVFSAKTDSDEYRRARRPSMFSKNKRQSVHRKTGITSACRLFTWNHGGRVGTVRFAKSQNRLHQIP